MNRRDTHLPLASLPDIADVQGRADTRHIAIDRVGIRGIRHPVTVAMADGGTQRTVGHFSLSVRLPEDVKGTHMSRFVELLEAERLSSNALDGAELSRLLARMVTKLGADEGHIEVTFPYFLEKSAPVSQVASLLDYQVTLSGAQRSGRASVGLKVVVPVTSLCPCSREISDYGAHNQRSHLAIAVEGEELPAVEELIRIAENEASSELYGILKRADEKYVTERAYDNPKFVEDLVRDLARALDAEPRVQSYEIEAENFESIHNHSAFAAIRRVKR